MRFELVTLVCGRCGASAPQDLVQGIPVDPAQWTVVTITGRVAGRQTTNRRLCPPCTVVRVALEPPGEDRAGRHRVVEAATAR
jgi:hypothetical protein